MSLELSNEAKIMLTKFAEMSQAIERVRELHKPVDLGSGYIECSECMASEHPCRTIRALDGEQDV